MSISQVSSQSMQLRAVAALRHTAASKSASATSAAPRPADSVELSDTAKALSSAAQTVAGATDVREDRVAAIKAAIANGTYSVDSKSLAQSMIKAGFGSAT